MRLRRFLISAAVFALLGGAQLSHAATIAVVLSEARGAYQEFADALRADIKRDGASHDVVVLDTEQLTARGLPEAQIVIGVGGRAAELLTTGESKAPLLLTLIPRSSYEKLPSARVERKTSALFIDQPPSRYIDLLRVALPRIERVGMLAGRDSRDNVARLMQMARERKLRPAMESVNAESDLFPAIQRLFADSGVLLATPDTSVFNTQTIPNIILSSYRFRTPVVGFSPIYVKSGALIAIYSTPAQIGIQSAEIARSVLAGNSLPAPLYPRLFSVGVNPAVARSLNIELDNENTIHDRVERLERGAQ